MLSAPSMFNAPSASAAAPTQSAYIQPTLGHGLRIWWAYYWPTNLIAGVIVAFFQFWLRKLYEDVILSAHATVIAMRILPYATTYIVAFFIIWYVLGKRFRHFRIALLPRAGATDAQPLRRTFKRTLRVWWTFSWRSALYLIIATFVATVSLGVLMGVLSAMGRAMAILVPLLESLLLSGAIGLFVIYSNILDEEFGDFRVVLLPRNSVPQALPTSTPATQDQAAV